MTGSKDDKRTGGKQRRGAEQQSTKRVGVYLTDQEYNFLKAVSDTVNKTMSLFIREAALKEAHKQTDLKLEDFSEEDE